MPDTARAAAAVRHDLDLALDQAREAAERAHDLALELVLAIARLAWPQAHSLVIARREDAYRVCDVFYEDPEDPTSQTVSEVYPEWDTDMWPGQIAEMNRTLRHIPAHSVIQHHDVTGLAVIAL